MSPYEGLNETPMQYSSVARRYPVGAEILESGTSFRLWAPGHHHVSVAIAGAEEHELSPEPGGYFSAAIPGVGVGARYSFRLDGVRDLLPDPASRFQPEGPSGPSVVVDPAAYQWRDGLWRGIGGVGQVFYEMHVGTFTRDGTWKAALEHLPKLRDTGITAIEMMPVNDFYGQFGWGYDGVLPYAPTRLYGSPDDLRAFIDEAHLLGLGVLLDVVYNHFGFGDRFEDFTKAYFSEEENEWGKALNFDGPLSQGTREFVAKNAAYWIDEYHFDGLRIDATQALTDRSDEHILAWIARECRAAAGDRQICLLAENEPQETRIVRAPEQGGYGIDALWNDDFHHSAMVALTGRNEAYYHDHRGTPQEFIAAAKYGYLFQGQRYDWQDHARGTPALDLEPFRFVHFLQNHDQVANSARGLRMDQLAAPARVRAMTALLLLAPQSPMLFQGQEFGASSPFLYFLDLQGRVGEAVREGRVEFLGQFPSLKDETMVDQMAHPTDRQTFERAKLDWAEYETHSHVVALHKDLLRLRREEPAFARQSASRAVDGSVLGAAAFLLRFFGERADQDRLLLMNFGEDLPIHSVPDPLIAPPQSQQWALLWSSEKPLYGGVGQRPLDLRKRFVLTANSAIVLGCEPAEPVTKRSAAETKAWQEAIVSGSAEIPPANA